MAFAKFKLKNGGKRIRIDLNRVLSFSELEEGTEIVLVGNLTAVVSDSFQVVSNQVAKNDKDATESAEPQA